MNDVVIRLKITLEDTEPPIWRRIEVTATTTLKELHAVIQAAMGWENAHLFQFEIGHRVSVARASLGDLVERGIKRFAYLYDMGDSWQHDLRIEKTIPADPATTYPRLVDGAGRCPPEDVGGIPGFYGFLEALNNPKHPDHDDLLDWHGGPFDPNADQEQIRKRLSKIAPRRQRKNATSKLHT